MLGIQSSCKNKLMTGRSVKHERPTFLPFRGSKSVADIPYSPNTELLIVYYFLKGLSSLILKCLHKAALLL